MIHYIGEYYNANVDRNLSYSPAGISKMDYMIDVLSDYNDSLSIFSTSRTLEAGYYKKKVCIENNRKYIYRSTFFAKGKLIRQVERWFAIAQILKYILFTVKKGDCVIAYHERYYQPWLSLTRKIKDYNLVYEVEELYTVAANLSSKKISKEKNNLCADSYVFSTESLNGLVNTQKKPYTVSHGAYRLPPLYNKCFDDDKIHIVYAGTFERAKGGAEIAIKSACYLSEQYHLHICGFGNDSEIEFVKNLIDEVSSKTKCKITFDGKKMGEEYLVFLQSCQIGLSTQKPEGDYNNTSFPSKILAYLSNGLQVITIKIPVIEASKVGNAVYYYNESDPKAVAETIMKINISSAPDTRKLVRQLDREFRNELYTIIYKEQK